METMSESARARVGPANDAKQRLVEVYHSDFGRLVGVASLLIDHRSEAEEVVQEAFVKLHARIRRIDDIDNASAYLRTTVVNLCRGRLRKRRSARRYLARGRQSEPLVEPSHADERLDGQSRRLVIDAVAILPQRQRECVVLRFYDQLDDAGIARTLGISVGSVKTHVHRAMQTLSNELEALS